MDIKTIIDFNRDASELPGKLKKAKLRWSQTRDGVTSVYAQNTNTGLNGSVNLYYLLRATTGMDPERKIFAGKTKDGSVAELFDVNEQVRQLVRCKVMSSGTISVSACELNEATKTSHAYGANRKGTAVLAALLPLMLDNKEAMDYYVDLMRYVETDPDDQVWEADPQYLEDFGKALTRFTSNLYFRTRYNATTSAGIEANLSKLNQLRLVDADKLTVVQAYTTEEPTVFKKAETGTKKVSISGSELKGKYSILSHKLTAKEEAMVPTMAPWYITPPWVETEAKVVQKSGMFPIPFRSLLLYGVSGTGKTEGAKAVFSALGIPAVSICCNVDMTMFDFLGQLIPNVDKYSKETSAEQVSKSLDIPTFDDVDNDFENTYLKLFGEAPDAFATPADCYSKINELMAGSASDGEPDFIYVESEFVKAYRNGWGIEIQEPTIIKRNSVLAGLNKALDNDPAAASITLPTGEIVHRHPDCMVIMTTNQDYDGCNNIQQSVLSRMQNKRRIETPTEDELVERTISETKFPDKAMLSTMAKVMRQLADYCNTADITDGVCGPRELANWAKRAYIDAMIVEDDENIKKIDKEYVVRAAFPTIIEKVSQVAEDQEQAVIEVIQKHFTEDLVMSARDEYIQGAA